MDNGEKIINIDLYFPKVFPPVPTFPTSLIDTGTKPKKDRDGSLRPGEI